MIGPDAATCVMVAAILGPLAGGDPDRYLALMVVLSLMTGILYYGYKQSASTIYPQSSNSKPSWSLACALGLFSCFGVATRSASYKDAIFR